MLARPGHAQPVDTVTSPRFDTLEVRWFAEGGLPAPVLPWFTRGGSLGTMEHRVDRYVLGGDAHVGVKYRDEAVPETKIRRSVDGVVVPPWGVEAPLESWRKWRDDDHGDGVEVDVAKVVFTRVFESAPAAGDHARCEVEIASLNVGEHHAWTLAFEASGGRARQESLLRWSLTHIADGNERIVSLLRRSLTVAASYPEWLHTRIEAVQPISPA